MARGEGEEGKVFMAGPFLGNFFLRIFIDMNRIRIKLAITLDYKKTRPTFHKQRRFRK